MLRRTSRDIHVTGQGNFPRGKAPREISLPSDMNIPGCPPKHQTHKLHTSYYRNPCFFISGVACVCFISYSHGEIRQTSGPTEQILIRSDKSRLFSSPVGSLCHTHGVVRCPSFVICRPSHVECRLCPP